MRQVLANHMKTYEDLMAGKVSLAEARVKSAMASTTARVVEVMEKYGTADENGNKDIALPVECDECDDHDHDA